MLTTTQKIASSLVLLTTLFLASGVSLAAECTSSTECYYTFSNNKYQPLDVSMFYEVVGDDYTPGCSLIGAGETQGHYFLPDLPSQIGLDNFQLIPDSIPTNICYPVTTDPTTIATISNIGGNVYSSDDADVYVQITIKDISGGTHLAIYYKVITMSCAAIGKNIAWSYDSAALPGAFKVTCE